MHITTRSPFLPTILFLALLIEFPALWATDGPWEKAQRECDRLREEGQYSAAEGFCRQALEEAEQLGALDSRLVVSQNNLATLYFRIGRPDEAETLLQRALETAQKQANPDAAQLAAVSNNLGEICLKRDQLPKPRTIFAGR